MTTATTVITASLKAAGIVGVGQTPLPQDLNDGLFLLNVMIETWQAEALVRVVPIANGGLPAFYDLTTDVPIWTGREAVLFWGLAARLRRTYGLPEDKEITEQASTLQTLLLANNKQQASPLEAGVPATPIQIIYLALRMAGRINDAQSVAIGSQDVDNAFSQLVMMLSQWSIKRWLMLDLLDLVLPSTGATAYTIGPGGNINVPVRPDQIEAAFARLSYNTSQPVDYNLQVLDDRQDFNSISFKNLIGFPSSVFYDPSYPLGVLYFNPIPQPQFELHVTVRSRLPTYATINDALNVPPEYNEAMVANLAVRLVTLTGGQPSAWLMSYARELLSTIRAAQIQIPLSRMPDGLRGTMPWYGTGLGTVWGGFIFPSGGGSPAGGGAVGGAGDFSPTDFGGDFSGGAGTGMTAAQVAALLAAGSDVLLGADGAELLPPTGA